MKVNVEYSEVSSANADLFYGARLKIDRARQLSTALETDMHSYLARDPVFWGLIESENRLLYWTFVVSEEPPEHLITQLGDVIHNLRASLDLMMFELVLPFASKLDDFDEENVSFPFSKKGLDGLQKRLKRCHVDLLPQSFVDAIIKLQPYAGGNTLLYALHQLDIRDKHRTLVPVVASSKMPNFQAANGMYCRENTVIGIQEGYRCGPVRRTPELVPGMRMRARDVSLCLAVNDELPRQLQPLLGQMTEAVHGVVDTFSLLHATWSESSTREA